MWYHVLYGIMYHMKSCIMWNHRLCGIMYYVELSKFM